MIDDGRGTVMYIIELAVHSTRVITGDLHDDEYG